MIDGDQLNLIANMIELNFHLQEDLNLNSLNSNYCTLTLDMMGNQGAQSEYIVTDDFKVTFSNPRFNINHWLRLYYYDLSDGDITDSHEYDTLKEKIIKLNDGENTISFDEPIVYLQQECTLIIKNAGG